MDTHASTSIDDHLRAIAMDGLRIEKKNTVFGGDRAIFMVGFGSHHRHGERRFSGCVILKWRITHLMDGKMTNVAAFSNVAPNAVALPKSANKSL